MTMRDILVEAKARIADPAHWTQGYLARDAAGNAVFSDNPNAVCWCAAGSVCATIFAHHQHECWLGVWNYMDSVAEDLYGEILADVNDSHGHEAIMRVFAVAIDRAYPVEES